MVELTKGWKSYLGATILILTGLYLISVGQEVAGAQSIGLGLGILGIRHYLSYSFEWMTIKRKIAIISSGALLGYLSGYFLGISLHDFLKDYFVSHFKQVEWFDLITYEKLYQKYSFGLRDLFGRVFGITSSAFLSYFFYLLSEKLQE